MAQLCPLLEASYSTTKFKVRVWSEFGGQDVIKIYALLSWLFIIHFFLFMHVENLASCAYYTDAVKA